MAEQAFLSGKGSGYHLILAGFRKDIVLSSIWASFLYNNINGLVPLVESPGEMMKTLKAYLSVLLLLVLAGCSFGIGAADPTSAPTLPPTTMPTEKPTDAPTQAPTPEPTEAAFVPFPGTLTVNGVNLRLNPGTLFGIKEVLPQPTTFEVQGRSNGSEWVYVKTAAGSEGWLFASLVKSDQSLTSAPVKATENTQIVSGKVVDASGAPVSGIQFSISQGDETDLTQTDVVTDANGEFYAYMPGGMSGMWAIVYAAITCKSNQMDSECQCLSGKCLTIQPGSINVILPQTEPVSFEWK